MAKPKVDKASGKGVSKDDCLALGQKALASFTGDELQDYVSEVFSLARSYPDVKGQAAIKRAMEEINKKQMEDLFHDCAVKANNTYKFEERAKLIRDKKSNLRNMLDYRGKRQGDTLSGAQSSARAKLAEVIYDENWSKEKEQALYDSRNDMSTYDALDGKDAPPLSKTNAEMVSRFRDARNAASVESNAIAIEHLSQYKYLDHMHDATLMMNGGQNLVQRAKNLARGIKTDINARQSWVNFIKDRLDLKAMFEGSKGVGIDGELNHEHIDKTLGNTYDNITTGKSELFTKSAVMNDREAVKRKQRMFLYFKDWRSWGEYNEKYGQGTLAQALQADLLQSGGKIGVADFFGDAPASMFMDLKKVQVDTGVDLGKFDTLQSWDNTNENTFKYLLGANPKSVRPTLTNFLSGLRSYTSAMSALKITVAGVTDHAHQAEFLGRQGVSRFKAMGTLLANVFDNKLAAMSYPERRVIARQFKLMVDSHMGYVARTIDAQNVGSFMNRVSSGVFKAAGVEAMDKGNVISVLHLMSDNMGRNSKKSWKTMNADLRSQLENHGFNEREWDLLRQKTTDKLFTLDNVNSLTDEELKGYHQELGEGVPLHQVKNDLYRKLYSYFEVGAQNAILNPNQFTKANMYGGTKPGTVLGELWKSMMQFHSYPMVTMDRVWLQGFQNADGAMAKMMFATRLMAMTMPYSFTSTWMANYLQGKSMPDMDDPKFWLSMALPGFGVFMSVLDKKNQNQDLLFNTLRSPSMGLISNMLASALSLITGDPDNAKKRFKKAVKTLSPTANVPFLTPFLNEALGEESYLQPGQRQIYGA